MYKTVSIFHNPKLQNKDIYKGNVDRSDSPSAHFKELYTPQGHQEECELPDTGEPDTDRLSAVAQLSVKTGKLPPEKVDAPSLCNPPSACKPP